MIPDPLFSTLLLVSLVWLCVMLLSARPSRCAPARHLISLPAKPPRKRSKEPTPFAGLTHKPHCALCEHETTHPKPRPPVPPAPLPATNRHTTPRDGVVHRRERLAPHAETHARRLHACVCA